MKIKIVSKDNTFHKHIRPYVRGYITEMKEITYEILFKDPYYKNISDEELEIVIDYMDTGDYARLLGELPDYLREEDLDGNQNIVKYLKSKFNENKVN